MQHSQKKRAAKRFVPMHFLARTYFPWQQNKKNLYFATYTLQIVKNM